MALSSEIVGLIEEIREDRVHGASWLSKQAINVLYLTAKNSQATSIAGYLEELKATVEKLTEAKPSMASIANCSTRFVYEVTQQSLLMEDLDSLKSFACSKAKEIDWDCDKAFHKVISHGADLIEQGDKILTCSYSSTICQTFKIAKDQGKDFYIFAAESRFNDKLYGKFTVEQLNAYGISAEVIPDNAIADYARKSNKVLTGADSVSADGSLVNGIPSYTAALLAEEYNIPFYSLCETTKFDIRSYIKIYFNVEEGFERIPSHLITGIITEKGTIKPCEVTGEIKLMKWLQNTT